MSDDDDGGSTSTSLSFLLTLERQLGARRMALLASALVLLVTDPIQFVRLWILEGVLVVLIDGVLTGFESLLRTVTNAWLWLGRTVWVATFGQLVEMVTTIGDLLLLVIATVENFARMALVQLGIAAPLAAALATGFTVIIFTLVGTVLYQLLATYIPLDAIRSIVMYPLVLLSSLASGAAQRLSRFVRGLRNRGS